MQIPIATLVDMVDIPDQWKDPSRIWYAIIEGDDVVACHLRRVVYDVETREISLGVEDLVHRRRLHTIAPADLHHDPDEAIRAITDRIREQLRKAVQPGEDTPE